MLRFAVFAVLGAACFYPSPSTLRPPLLRGRCGSQISRRIYSRVEPAARFEGSSSTNGSVFDLATGVGYNFNRHFAVHAGIPYYFVGTLSSIKRQNPNAVSGTGFGNIFTDLKLNFPGETLNYDSAVHLTAPTGDTKKGFSTGHATWNWVNHVEHGWGNFTPYLDAGVGNTVTDTRFFHRPFITSGYNAQFEGGPVRRGSIQFDDLCLRCTPLGTANRYQQSISLLLGGQMYRE